MSPHQNGGVFFRVLVKLLKSFFHLFASELDDVIVDSIWLVVEHDNLIFIEHSLLQVTFHQCFASANFDSNLVSFHSGYFPISHKDFSCVLVASISVVGLSLWKRVRSLVVTLLVVVEVSEDSPVCWRLLLLDLLNKGLVGSFVLWFFLLQNGNCSLDSWIRVWIGTVVSLLLELLQIVLETSLRALLLILAGNNFQELLVFLHVHPHVWLLLQLDGQLGRLPKLSR